jgi:outer membrane protein assembly factor BamB
LTTVWHKTLAARANPPAIANGIVYISTLDYNLRGYDLKTGEEWHLGRYDCYSQPIIANHTLL